MNLIIDIGNTQYKICVFNNFDIVYHTIVESIDKLNLSNIISEYKIKNVIYSDTRGVDHLKLLQLLPSGLRVVELNHNTPLPIKIEYTTPETLGKDRIAGAVEAANQFKNLPCLVIDIGTALTIDFIDENNTFKGGNISPGPELRYRALHEFTGKLPRVQSHENVSLLGNSTQTAIQSGVQNGILFEINGYILRLKEQYPEIKIILTGGFAFLFDKKINYPIFADSFLVPKGLNRILKYNEL
jgi:type III pantothenate kinase